MAKLTSEQIETAITELSDSEGGYMQRKTNVREAFTLGVDHGTACVIERAESLLAVADSTHEAIGRAVVQLTTWAAMRFGRKWDFTPLADGRPAIWLYAAEGEKLEDDLFGGSSVIFRDGSELAEAFAVAATWCLNHSEEFPVKASSHPPPRDTSPAPALAECDCSGAAPQNGMHEPFCATVDSPETERNL